MKFFSFLVLILLFTSCTNPATKYTESLDALTAALKIGEEVIKVQDIIDGITEGGSINLDSLDSSDTATMISALTVISENLDNSQVQSIISSYAEQYNVDLDTAIADIKSDISTIAIQDRDGDGNTDNETEILTLVNAIIAKL